MKGETLRTIGKFLQRHGPSILSLLGCAGVVTTVVFAVDEVPKVKKDLDERKVVPQKAQKVKIIVSGCKKTLISGAATMGCIMGANAWNTKQKSNLIAGVAALGTAYRSLRSETVKLLGEEKVEEIERKIAAEAQTNKELPEKPKKYGRMVLIWDNWMKRAYYTEDYYYALYRLNNDLRCYHNVLFDNFLAYLKPIDPYTGERLDKKLSYGRQGWNDEGYPLIEASDQYVDPNWLPLDLVPNDDPEISYDYILNYGEYEPYDTIENKY